LVIALPPLRERRVDVALLAEYFLRRAEVEMSRKIELTPEALARLEAYAWPGNVRQLENEIRRCAALADGVVRPGDLSPEIGGK
jgi:transcriptional regulator with GAF, ATPase, and Fis domain